MTAALTRRGFLGGASALALSGTLPARASRVLPVKPLYDTRWEWVGLDYGSNAAMAPGNAAWLKLYEDHNEQILAMARIRPFGGPLRSHSIEEYEAHEREGELRMAARGIPDLGPTMPRLEQLPPLLDIEAARKRLSRRGGHWRHPDYEVWKRFMEGPPDDVFEEIATAADRDIVRVVARNHGGA